MNYMTQECVVLFAWWGAGLIGLSCFAFYRNLVAPAGAPFTPVLSAAGHSAAMQRAIESQSPPLVRRA